jgi:hypothetical protein
MGGTDASLEQNADHQRNRAQLTTRNNAVSESFNSTVELELLRQRHFAIRAQARREVAQ